MKNCVTLGLMILVFSGCASTDNESAKSQPTMKSLIDKSIPIDKRILDLDTACQAFINQRGPSTQKFYALKLKEAKDSSQSAEKRETAMMPIMGLCVGSGLKL